MEHTYIKAYDFRFDLPKLKTLCLVSHLMNDGYFDDYTKSTLDAFRGNESIEKFHLECRDNWPYDFFDEHLNEFLKTLPNVKHLVLNSYEYTYVNGDFPLKLETLEIFGLSDDQTCLDFLRGQKGSLKDLIMLTNEDYEFREYFSDEPTFEEDGNLIKFVFKEMNLRNFQWHEVSLIADYVRQPESFF
jgi:hypothetical protein